jgi:hypothetical protein
VTTEDGAPPGAQDPPDFAIKRFEELYRYAQSTYQQGHARWTAADEKASKYLSILGVVIGAGAVTIGEAAKIVAQASTYADWTFVVTYTAGAAFAVASFVCFASALRIQNLEAPSSAPEVITFFSDQRYVDVLHAMSREYLESTERMQQTVEGKFSAAGTGFELMRLAGLCLLVATAMYFSIRVGHVNEESAATRDHIDIRVNDGPGSGR